MGGKIPLPVFPMQFLQTSDLAPNILWLLVSTFLPFGITCQGYT